MLLDPNQVFQCGHIEDVEVESNQCPLGEAPEESSTILGQLVPGRRMLEGPSMSFGSSGELLASGRRTGHPSMVVDSSVDVLAAAQCTAMQSPDSVVVE